MKNETNKNRKQEVAAALRYIPDEHDAPVVVAGGKGHMAKYIKDIAKANEIPIYKDENLAHTLVRLGIGTEIPEDLYKVVAEILIFVARIDKKHNLE